MNIEHIYLINHCHVDLGFTGHAESLWQFYNAMIERAMDLIEATAEYPPEAQFKYTCEVTCIVDHFLRTAPAKQVERFVSHEHAGRIDIGAMWAHFTPLVTPEEMRWTMDQVRRLRKDYGFSIHSAMTCDVNGLPWTWVDELLDAQVIGLTMAST